MIWELLTSKQISRLSKDVLVLQNIAAVEQHGPALPLATDSIIGARLVAAVEEQLAEKVLVLPQIKVGCSAHHLDFPGTLSVGHLSFLGYAVEILDTAVSHGFHKVLLLNSHGGNIAIGQVLIEQMQHEHSQVDFAFTSWWQVCRHTLQQQQQSGFTGNGHAAEFEYSLIDYLAPELIDREVAPACNLPHYPFKESAGDLIQSGSVKLGRNFKELTTDGTHGTVEHAHANKGKVIFAAAVEGLNLLINELIALPPR